MNKKIGLIGDAHAEHKALYHALNALMDLDLDLILCTGDIVDGTGDVDECCRLLVEYNVECVRGNHDRWLIDNELRDLPDATMPDSLLYSSLSYIKNLPKTIEIESASGKILLSHGIGEDDMCFVHPDDYGYSIESNIPLQELIISAKYQTVIGGHTHMRMVRNFGSINLINPGTLIAGKNPGFAALNCIDNTVMFFDMDDNNNCKVSQIKTLLNNKVQGFNGITSPRRFP